ncbi:HNH endonuclease [Photobacterium swingsii]|uniref:HNH endonuclease n=1 Tax=Photobacterium swingsii TaxID=680026 RepID=UPI00352DC716
MKSSPLPNIIEPDNFEKFIKYRSGDTRVNLLNVQKKIVYYYSHYNNHGEDVHKIIPNKLKAQEKNTMIDVYESYTSKAIISFRDTLFTHISNCPYCGLGETVHLDHYLPKSEFSEYSLFTLNLIPCCYKCNSTYKKTGYNENGTRVYFHPYIDEINDFDVLRISLRFQNDCILLHYGINQSSTLGPGILQVLKKHFKHLKLRERYLKYANRYLADMKPVFNDDYGANRDSQQLMSALDSKYKDALAEFGRNHWKTALLKNLKNNNQFCNGGFLLA